MKIINSLLLMSFLMILSIKCSFASNIESNRSNIVTLVEYYDYECLHCRRMERVIDRLQIQYPKLQVVYRATPLLNSQSYQVASFSLATRLREGKEVWRKLHQQLMQLSRSPTLGDAQGIATALGLNMPAILKEMQQSEIQQMITKNIELAETHAIAGYVSLPILVFGLSNGKGQIITLTGEQSYELLSAIVQQLMDDQHVQLVQTFRKTKSSR